MRAQINNGILITLTTKDKEIGEQTGRLECTLVRWQKPKLTLHIVDQIPQKGYHCESGFYIEAFPEGGGPECKTQYTLYLSKKRFQELTTPQNRTNEGHFTSRCMYDQVDFNYWNL